MFYVSEPKAWSSVGVRSPGSSAVPGSEGRCPPHQTLLPSPSQGGKKPDQDMASMVQNGAGTSDPLISNEALVTDHRDLPFFKAWNL